MYFTITSSTSLSSSLLLSLLRVSIVLSQLYFTTLLSIILFTSSEVFDLTATSTSTKLLFYFYALLLPSDLSELFTTITAGMAFTIGTTLTPSQFILSSSLSLPTGLPDALQ